MTVKASGLDQVGQTTGLSRGVESPRELCGNLNGVGPGFQRWSLLT